MLVSLVNPSKALSVILEPLVIVTEVRLSLGKAFIATVGISAVSIGQSLNAFTPIFVTLEGMVILVNAPHPLNAFAPISSTLSGIVMLSNALHPLNALSPIYCTP